ncbi:MAG: diheme cytochrome c-553 [Acidobacteria bacterium]|nr:MAG: diheme cytochrome c-553 [Acidobacteriota bacterium]
MTRRPLIVLAAVAVVAASFPLLGQQPPASPYPPPKPEALAPAGSAKRGAQLVNLGGCHDCHTPKLEEFKPDTTRLLSGHPASAPLAPEVVGGISTNMQLTAWRGPWGVTLSRNLTPDKETGIGSWTVTDFKKAIRTGVNPTGEVILPHMPIAFLQNLPDSDLEAIYAYLRSIKPVRNQVGRITAKTPAR